MHTHETAKKAPMIRTSALRDGERERERAVKRNKWRSYHLDKITLVLHSLFSNPPKTPFRTLLTLVPLAQGDWFPTCCNPVGGVRSAWAKGTGPVVRFVRLSR
eukprot:2671029-Amphidinium_carterae.1